MGAFHVPSGFFFFFAGWGKECLPDYPGTNSRSTEPLRSGKELRPPSPSADHDPMQLPFIKKEVGEPTINRAKGNPIFPLNSPLALSYQGACLLLAAAPFPPCCQTLPPMHSSLHSPPPCTNFQGGSFSNHCGYYTVAATASQISIRTIVVVYALVPNGYALADIAIKIFFPCKLGRCFFIYFYLFF